MKKYRAIITRKPDAPEELTLIRMEVEFLVSDHYEGPDKTINKVLADLYLRGMVDVEYFGPQKSGGNDVNQG